MIEIILNLILLMIFVYIIWIDCKFRKIYNKTLGYLMICLVLRLNYVFWNINIIGISLLINSIIFIIIYYLSKGLGAGDVKLAMVLALYCPYPNCILAIYLSFIIGGLVALICLVLLKNSKNIPFAPILILGNYLANNYADEILLYWFEVII